MTSSLFASLLSSNGEIMFDLLQIPDCCICNKIIPNEKIFSSDEIKKYNIESITWYASLKPELINSATVINELARCEEIQLITIKVSNEDFIIDNVESDKMYEMLRIIFKSIKYHVFLVINYKDKFKMVACKYNKGKVDSTINVLKSITISNWIHREYQTKETSENLSAISEFINSGANLQEIYNKIFSCINNCSFIRIRKRFVKDYIDYLHTRTDLRLGMEVISECSVYKHHSAPPKNSRYSKAQRSSTYIFMYDPEEIWYSFMKNDELRESIQRRRIRTMDELNYYVYNGYRC